MLPNTSSFEPPQVAKRPAGAVTQAEFSLDLLRAVAALLVLVSHWRILFFQDYPKLVNPSPVIKVFYFVTGIGYPSVMVFFVLSGFLVTGSALRAVKSGRWSIASYLNQRLTRLWVVLIPALFLCWAWDAVGLRLYPHLLYDGTLKTIAVMPDVAARHGMFTLLQNMFFLQGISSITYGTDDPLWSLSYEFWYYIFLIPLLSIFMGRKLWIRLASGVLLMAGLAFVGHQIRVYFIIWLLGALISVIAQAPLVLSHSARRALVGLSLLLLTAALAARRAYYLPLGVGGDLVIGLSCAFFVWAVSRTTEFIDPSRFTGLAKNVAGWSYSLYLLHLPILVFLASIVFSRTQWLPDARHLALALLLLALVLGYSYLVSLLTERHTNSVRRFVEAFSASAPK